LLHKDDFYQEKNIAHKLGWERP